MPTPQRNCDESLLYPPFAQRVSAGLQIARNEGLAAFLFEGWRAPERQDALYAQGRTTPGTIVTRARAWQSWHQYGLAVDMAFGGPGKWSWAGNWARLGAIMQAQGLEWYGAPGASFKETPHFQDRYGMTLTEVMAIAHTQGVPAVWARAAASASPLSSLFSATPPSR